MNESEVVPSFSLKEIHEKVKSVFANNANIFRGLTIAGVSSRELKRRELEEFCLKYDYFKRDKKPLPKLVTKILALTSKSSEIHDDLLSNVNLHANAITVINCHTSIDIAKQITNAEGFDIAVLFRGGREDDAMAIFSEKEVIQAIAESDIPICAALGHELDEPFIYKIADKTSSTPSSFGKEITAHNMTVSSSKKQIFAEIADALSSLQDKMAAKTTDTIEKIEALSQILYERAVYKIGKLSREIDYSQLQIKNTKDEQIESIMIKVHHAVEKIHSDKLKNITTKMDQIDTLCRNISNQQEERLAYREREKESKEKNNKLIFAIILILMILLFVIWKFVF